MATVKEIILRHDGYVTATVNAYTSRLEDIVTIATARTTAELQHKLDILPDGTIANTAANQRVLRGLDQIFQEEMDAAGYQALNKAYTSQFAGQLQFLDDIIDKIGESLNKPLPDVKDAIKAEDRRVLASQQTSTIAQLDTVLDTVAASAKRQALFSVAGLSAKDLASTLATAFQKTVGQSSALAETAQVAFYRTVSDKSFRVIEEDLPGFEIRYEYDGPLDKLNRPVCRHWREQSIAGKRWTRKEIDELDNGPGQPKPVFIFCGGVRCRHQFVISV